MSGEKVQEVRKMRNQLGGVEIDLGVINKISPRLSQTRNEVIKITASAHSCWCNKLIVD